MEGVQGKMIGSKKEGNIYIRKKEKIKHLKYCRQKEQFSSV